jgi:hypothetical protein
MKLERWLFGALTLAALACSSGEDVRSDENPSAQDDDDADDDGDDEGARPDAGPKKPDGGKPKPGTDPMAGDDDDDDDSPSGGGDEEVCDSLDIQAKPNSPEIMIVLDRSGSMLGGAMPGGGQMGMMPTTVMNRWVPSASAVKKLTMELDEVVAFGLMLFPSPAPGGMQGGGGRPGGGFPNFGASCTAGKVDVAIDLGQAEKIGSAIDMGMPDQFAMTPTAATLEAALAAFQNNPNCSDCAEREKFVLLVTDGQPTCGMGGMGPGGGMTTQAEIDATVAAIDKLKMAGIKTYVVGYDTKTDMALATTMDLFAMRGDTGMHFAVENEAQLVTDLRNITARLISCEFDLNDEVEDPKLVRVIIDGEEFELGNGWTLDGKKVVLGGEDTMGICPKIKDGRVHTVKIKKVCEPRAFQ